MASLRIGVLELQDCVVEVSADDSVVGQDGIIGTHIFAQYLVMIDFKRHRPELEAPLNGLSHPTSHSLLAGMQAYLFGHLLLVPASIGNELSGLFIVDSGANKSTVSNDLATWLRGMRSFNRSTIGLTGSTENKMMADNMLIKFGDVVIRNQTVVTLDLAEMSKRVGTTITGQIGFNALAQMRLVIDYQHGRVAIENE